MRIVVSLAAIAALACALPSSAAAAKKPKGFFGVVSQAPLKDVDYARMNEGNVQTMRIAMSWASAQQVPGRCQAGAQVGICSWTVLDDTIGRAAAAGVRVLPVVAGVPVHLAKDPKTAPLRGKRKRGWQAFLRAAAERYGRNGRFWNAYDDYGAKPRPITEWQIWNEPNSKAGWKGSPNPREYAKLVKISAKAVKRGDRKADIVLAGMFGDSRLPLPRFMRSFYKSRRIERHFDALALHPYAPQVGDLKRQLRDARRALRRGGDGKARIAVTEMGWSSGKGGHPLMKGKKGQAKMLEKSFRLLRKKRRAWNISGVNWFALQDTNDRSTCRFCLDSGLIQTDGGAKPAWRSFKRFSK